MKNLEFVSIGQQTVLEELKQRVLTKVAKIDRYTKRIMQFKQNRHFTIDQKNYLPS